MLRNTYSINKQSISLFTRQVHKDVIEWVFYIGPVLCVAPVQYSYPWYNTTVLGTNTGPI